MPIQPKEPSCHAISIQVSIISANVGSTPPASTGLKDDIRPLSHISSTIAGDMRAQPLGLGGLGAHQVAHPARHGQDLVPRVELSTSLSFSDLVAAAMHGQ